MAKNITYSSPIPLFIYRFLPVQVNMPEIRVVIVGPKYEGNVGAIARSMANFDIKELYLVNPCEIGDDAYRRSKHGADILDNAVIVNSLE